MLRAYAAVLLALLLATPPAARAAACPDEASLAALHQSGDLPGDVYVYNDADEDEGDDEDTVPQPDTTIAVRPGVTLVIENFGGAISVKTWDQDAVKIAAVHSLRDKVMIERTGSAILLKVKSRRWVPATVQYRIVAPRWMKLELSGVNTDIDVEDSRGEVRAETVQGDITLRGSEGFASLSSVQGEIVAKGVRGRIEASSVNQAVRLSNVVGPIFAESVNGGIIIEGSQSDSVEASTVNGPVTFEGRVSDQGFYRFATHNGCIDVAMPERSNATVSLSTFSGGIDSSFPVTLKKVKSRRFQTTLGSGLARFELESFQGTIFLRRPEEARSQCDSDSDSDEDEDTKSDKHHKMEKADKGEKEIPEEDPGE